MAKYSQEYQAKLREEWEAFAESDLWREILKAIIERRKSLSRTLEINRLDSVQRMYDHALTQGKISGVDMLLRIIMEILKSDRVPGITGVIPGFE